ncbi:stage II sporulation protein M [Staphylococcus simulans]
MLKSHKSNVIIFIIIYVLFAALGFGNTTSSDEKLEISNGFLHYFENNMMFCLLISSGLFLFSLSTFLFLCPNAYILGASIKSAIIDDVSTAKLIYSLLHGIFELPGIYFFFCIGVLPLQEAFKYLFSSKYEFVLNDLMAYVLKHFTVGTAFILIAALIESLL